MTALLPEVVRDAVRDQTVNAASTSFGIVTLVVLVVLLLELEALRVTHKLRDRSVVLAALAPVLIVAVGLTLVARVAELVP